MRSAKILSYLNTSLPGVLGKEGVLSDLIPVGGGSINEAYAFTYAGSKYFLKVNRAKRFPGMFAVEAKGLGLLASNSSLVVPKVVHAAIRDEEQYLVLEFLERRSEDGEFFHGLGKGLAELHKHTNERFGLDHSNYIGSLPQDNTQKTSWNEFFICNRMEPLLKQAMDEGKLPATSRKNFESLFRKLDEVFPMEKPALLHGDLWSGNKMSAVNGPCIFDPAVYYGHREVDIAMTQLFGGFTSDFYRGYNDTFALEKGLEERISVFNLYPLLVHTVLFGSGYAQDVLATIRRF